jgi:hypothetical protein
LPAGDSDPFGIFFAATLEDDGTVLSHSRRNVWKALRWFSPPQRLYFHDRQSRLFGEKISGKPVDNLGCGMFIRQRQMGRAAVTHRTASQIPLAN